MQKGPGRAPTLPHALQHSLERLAFLDAHFRQQVPAAGETQGADRGWIGFDDTEVFRTKQQHSLIRRVKEKAIAGLDLSQLPVVLLHGLLGGHQARLQFGHGFQIAADGDQSRFAAEANRRVLHRHFPAAGKSLVDLAEGRDAALPGVLYHAQDLAAAVTGGFDPWTTAPVIDSLIGHVVGQRDVLNDALQIKGQGHIRLGEVNARISGCSDCTLLGTVASLTWVS